MVKKNLEIILLSLILIFAFFLYTFKLSTTPSGVYVDEAVAAYDSYSLIQTGADHYGQKFPLTFRFFGAYTPSLFVYLNTIPIKIFGFNNFSIRFLSVISMLVQIIFLYLIFKKLFNHKSYIVNLISILFIVISPWIVFNARLGYEVTLAQTFLTAAVYFLLKSTSQPKFLLISSLLFSFSIHSAHTQKILVPLIIIFSFFILKIWRYPKKIIIYSFLILLVTQIPNLFLMTTKSFWTKSSSISTNYPTFIDNLNYQFWQTISPKTWFNQTLDIDLQHQIPELAPFYFWMFLPIFIGFLKVFFNKNKSLEFSFIKGLFILSIIPGIISGRFMSTQRLIPLIIPFSIFFVLGLSQIIIFIKNKKILFITFLALFFYSLILLFRSYFILLPKINAFAWNYGASQVAQYIQSNPDKHFIIDNTRNSRQYILILYYLKYDPQKFHSEIGESWSKDYYNNINYLSNISFSNIEVRPISSSDFENKNNIIIGDDVTISESEAKIKCLKTIQKILYPTQKIAYIIYQPDICSKKN